MDVDRLRARARIRRGQILFEQRRNRGLFCIQHFHVLLWTEKGLAEVRLRIQIDSERTKIAAIGRVGQLTGEGRLSDASFHVDQANGYGHEFLLESGTEVYKGSLAQTLNSVASFFFTAVFFSRTYSGRPFLYFG